MKSRTGAITPETMAATDRAVLDAIRQFWTENHYGPGEGDIAAALRTTRPIARAAIKRLADSGWIVRPARVQHAMRAASADEQRRGLIARCRRVLEGLPLQEREAFYRAACEIFEGSQVIDRNEDEENVSP